MRLPSKGGRRSLALPGFYVTMVRVWITCRCVRVRGHHSGLTLIEVNFRWNRMGNLRRGGDRDGS